MEILRRLRTERGLSQARLAARAELDPSTVNQIERGAREASPATLRKLADALDVSLADLLEDTSPKAQSPLPLEEQQRAGIDVGEAFFVPLEEGEEDDTVTLEIRYVRLLKDGEPVLQAVRKASPEEEASMRKQLEKSGRSLE